MISNKPEILRILSDSALSVNFIIEVDGMLLGGFKEVVGLEESVSSIKIRENNSDVSIDVHNDIVMSDVTMKQGLRFGEKLFSWFKQYRDYRKLDDDFRKTVSIVQIKMVKGIPVEFDRWILPKCYVKKYKAPAYSSDGNEVSKLEIVLGRDMVMEKPYSFEAVSSVTAVLELIF